ncbi:MAG: HD domain-containing protein [Oscillospiraceae bacterium]|jgi:uncharacterized protein|nr:HD domain-containing protein [Oscillospiraceae bacterium]
MNLPAMQSLAEQLLKPRKAHIDREKGGIYCHGQRVANTALLLRRAILPEDGTSDGMITAAAWFHDIGKDLRPHAHYGAVLAREALAPHCSAGELDEICEIISLHCERCPGGNGYSPALKLLQDADMLDHCGSYMLWMDIWRCVCQEVTWQEMACFDESRWAKHCAKNRALLNFPLSQSIFDEKNAFINAVYARMRVECIGEIVGLEDLA